MSCPLCGEKKFLTLRQDRCADLSSEWVTSFGFDPFKDFVSVEIIEKRACMECRLVYYFPEIYGDDEFYSKLSKNPWYYESDKWEFDQALSVVREYKPGSILEIGCGAGEFLQKVAPAVDYHLGLDINHSALTKSEAKGLNVGNESLNNIDRCFDMVVLFQVLEHLARPGDFFREIYKKINPGGIIILAVPNPEGYLKEMGTVLLDMPPHHNSGWRKETFDWLSKSLGMEIIQYDTEPLRYVHYQSYLFSFISNNTSNRYLRKLQQLAARVIAPFLFSFSREKIIGQTHLVVLKKMN